MEYEPSIATITASIPEAEVTEPPKPQIPPRPVMPPEAADFPKLQKIKIALDNIPHSVPQKHIRKNVPSGKKPTEKKPLQKPKPCTTRYSDIKKRLTDRTPANLTETEIKGRDKSLLLHINF